MLQQLTLMIVDDDADDREMFVETVGDIDSGIKCINAGSGYKALELLKNDSNRPSIIFLDLNMPKISGLQCLQQIKKCDRLKEIPVVIFTTSKQIEDKEDTQKAGASYFLTKPNSVTLLKKELLQVLLQVLSIPVS